MSRASASPVSGAGRDHERSGGLDALDHAALETDTRMRFDPGGDLAAEDLAIDGERSARRDARALAGGHDERAAPTHLLFEQADRVAHRGAAKRVRADELRELIALLRGRAGEGFLFDEHHLETPLGELPRALAAGETRADDRDRRARG